MTAVFLIIDAAFLGANLIKIADGGWLPLAIGAVLVTLMTTRNTGRRIVAKRLTERALPMQDFLASVATNPPARVPGTAVFMTAQPTGTPPALVHNVRHNKVVHDHVVLLTARTQPTPFVSEDDRIAIERLAAGIVLKAQYGFMEDTDVPQVLEAARQRGVELDVTEVTYFLGRETLIVTARKEMARWREKLLPPQKVVELGCRSRCNAPRSSRRLTARCALDAEMEGRTQCGA